MGLVYVGLMAGFAAGVALSATVMDRLAMRRSEKEGSHRPENRLVPIVYASPLIPAGLLLYGWSLQAGLHFSVPIVGSALVGAGMVLTLVCLVMSSSPAIFPAASPPSLLPRPALTAHAQLAFVWMPVVKLLNEADSCAAPSIAASQHLPRGRLHGRRLVRHCRVDAAALCPGCLPAARRHLAQ